MITPCGPPSCPAPGKAGVWVCMRAARTDYPCKSVLFAKPNMTHSLFRIVFKFIYLLLAAALMTLASTASAGPMGKADQRQIRDLISHQLAAFAADDAAKAFSYASPEVQQAFGTADNFMVGVRRDYAVLYRHRSVAFQPAQAAADGVVQRLYLTDEHGQSWVATYLVQRLKYRGWRIAACTVARNAGVST